jgi:DNA-binding transcriptional LysR family regulator
MDISALRALVALRELASFARVSERVNLSSSAVFCQIRQLEDQLGQKLYERQGKALQLTPGGNSLASCADKIVHMHDFALNAMKPSATNKRRLIRLGCGPHGSVEIVPYFVQALVRQDPGAEISMFSADDNTLLNDLRTGLLDALLMSLPAEPAGLEQMHLWTFEQVVVFPPMSSGLFTNLQMEDLRTAPFILYSRPVMMYDAHQQLCRDLGFELNVVMENDEPDSIKELIKLGLGVSFLPFWSVAEEERKGKLRILRPPRSQRYKYGLLYRKSAYEANILKGLIQVAPQWNQWWPLAKYVLPPKASV